MVGILVCLAVGDLVGEVLGIISLKDIRIDERVVRNEAGLTVLIKFCASFRNLVYFLDELGVALARQ